MFTLKSALVAASLITLGLTTAGEASARTVWYGPGSGPYSPYSRYLGWAQMPRQPSYFAPVWNNNINYNRTTGNPIYHCVPNVGNTGADGVCH